MKHIHEIYGTHKSENICYLGSVKKSKQVKQ